MPDDDLSEPHTVCLFDSRVLQLPAKGLNRVVAVWGVRLYDPLSLAGFAVFTFC